MAGKIKVGIIGCGNICSHYFQFMRMFPILEVVACADLDCERAKARGEEFQVPRVCTIEQLLGDPEIQIVVNLTPPLAHTPVNLQILAAGKHVYCEKPLAVTREDGQRTLEEARRRGLLVGCAPDTFLGGGIQTCRKLIDDGAIGRPISAVGFFCNRGMEMWHPNPEFFFKFGGGPMLDVGPYIVTALVNLLGPIRSVSGLSRINIPERVVTSQPNHGQVIKVETDTHIAGLIDFASGAVGTIITSFEMWNPNLPRIEVYGTEGTLSVPDPNGFTGPVKLFSPRTGEWSEVPLTHSDQVGRGIGVADMAYALLGGRAPRASGELSAHVLDAMLAFTDSSRTGQRQDLICPCTQPLPLPTDLASGQLDD